MIMGGREIGRERRTDEIRGTKEREMEELRW